MIIFYVIVLTLSIPESLASIDVSSINSDNSQLEFSKIIMGFVTIDYVKIIVGCLLFIISFPFFFLTTLISYMNVLDQKGRLKYEIELLKFEEKRKTNELNNIRDRLKSMEFHLKND